MKKMPDIKKLQAAGEPHRFKPGQSGNPGGRPREVPEIKALAREHGPEAIARLAELLKSKDGKVAVAAARELLDRGYGRAPQEVHIDGYEVMPTGRLMVLAREAMAVLEEHAAEEPEPEETKP